MNPSLGFYCPMGCRGQRTKPRATEGEEVMVRPLHTSSCPQGYTLRVRWPGSKYLHSPQASARQTACLDTQHEMDRAKGLPLRIHNLPGGPKEPRDKRVLKLFSTSIWKFADMEPGAAAAVRKYCGHTDSVRGRWEVPGQCKHTCPL